MGVGDATDCLTAVNLVGDCVGRMADLYQKGQRFLLQKRRAQSSFVHGRFLYEQNLCQEGKDVGTAADCATSCFAHIQFDVCGGWAMS